MLFNLIYNAYRVKNNDPVHIILFVFVPFVLCSVIQFYGNKMRADICHDGVT